MLFARCQGEDIGKLTLNVRGRTDQAASQFSDERFVDSEEAQVWTAIGERDTKRLTIAYDDVRANLTGRGKEGKRGRICRNSNKHAFGVRGFDQRLIVDHSAKKVRVLHDHKRGVIVNQSGEVLQISVNTDFLLVTSDCEVCYSLHVGSDDFAILGIKRAGEQHFMPFAPEVVISKDDRFSTGGGTVVVGGVADIHAGEQADQALELKDRLERALGDLGLVGGVGRVKLAALEEVIDRGRDVVLVRASTQEANKIAGGGVG